MSSPELLRHALLLQLSAALPASLSADTLQLGLSTAGFRLPLHLLHTELIYLQEKGLLHTLTQTLSPAPRYRLSAQGRDYLQSQNLA